ncbi:MAG: right-handed parallel beta-helix repeat-containing protein [Bacteroidota bacterium]
MKQPQILTTLILLLLATNQLFADTIPDGSLIYGTWRTSNSPYIVMGEVEVPYDSILIIEAGVTVKLKSSTKDSAFYYPTLDVALLKVYGRIIAEGNETDSIIFEKAGDGRWGSISFLGYTNEPNIIKYCQVSYGNNIGTAPGGTGYIGGIAFNGANAIIKHSLFHHNNKGISWGNSNIVVENCIIRNNTYGISCGSSSSIINNNWVYNNQDVGISTHSTNSVITNNIIENSLTGINCYESNDTISYNIVRNNLWGGIKITRNNSVVNYNIIYGSNSGIRCSGKPVINNNTIVNNNYFGIYCDYDANPIISNSIIYGNQNLITYSQEDSVIFANCLVQVDSLPDGIINGGGNIYNQDPYFTNISNEDFSLSINSPCIDAGTAFFIWEKDTILNLSSDDYFGNAPDIGAIESAFVSIKDKSQLSNTVIIMPNPASSIINIYSPIKIEKMIISDLSGKFTQQNSVLSNSAKIDIRNLPNGLYLINLLLDNKLTVTKKVMITSGRIN